MKHKKICLEVNGKQNLKLESGTIKFKSYSKEIAVPFKIYADFESLLKGLRINDRDKNPSYTDKIPRSYSLQFCLRSCIY